ncbi:Acetyl esterase/lipase [Ferrimonas sediminum]|uniref:Acetyl esterase/lipase n=1 Tax=Ferrimonas sediminum TaxID=718193 RepID=A0A1G8S2C6_9GAMM|nr:alpha/beta hydrolase [Ferrimonas sediminum]SDJ22925.1 Acetyl esterase/lipase [Ferrimonas sediminum]
MNIKSPKNLLVTALALGFLAGCAVENSNTMDSALTADASKNVREFIDPDIRAPLDQMPSELAVITRDTVLEARATVHNMLKFPDTPGVTVEQKHVVTADGEVPVFVYRPENSAAVTPAILWIHGGGYVMGRADSNDFTGEFAKELGATVISVEYRLAPEHPFPAGHNDVYAAFLWAVRHAEELGIDPDRIAVGGDSAGAGMAAGMVLHNRDAQGPAIALQLLIYPMLDNLHNTPSGSVEDYPVWNRQTSFNAWEMYLGGTPGAAASPYAAPARAKEMGGLPKTYMTIGAVDLFRDEVVDYAQRLMAAGVSTELAVFPGMYHGGQVFVPGAPVSQKMRHGYLSALKNALAEK